MDDFDKKVEAALSSQAAQLKKGSLARSDPSAVSPTLNNLVMYIHSQNLRVATFELVPNPPRNRALAHSSTHALVDLANVHA